MSTKRTIRLVAVAVAAVHLIGVLLTCWYVAHSAEGQSPLAWTYWMVIDLPWSIIVSDAANAYVPIFVHGVVGTVWWYFLSLGIGKIIN